ncbi:MAG: hypothetical protein JXM69_16460 [Anaerolineae bacterium]|nr:hypothetical protein [Anaerolineae bacterium]
MTPNQLKPVTSPLARLKACLRVVGDWARGFIYGMTYFEMEQELRRQRADLEHLFVLISFGDLLGVPILPPYYSIRLLPYIVPMIDRWRRRMLREKDLTDLVG